MAGDPYATARLMLIQPAPRLACCVARRPQLRFLKRRLCCSLALHIVLYGSKVDEYDGLSQQVVRAAAHVPALQVGMR